MRRQGQLDEDAVHRRVFVELGDEVQKTCLCDLRTGTVFDRMKAKLAGKLELAPHINLARRILAH